MKSTGLSFLIAISAAMGVVALQPGGPAPGAPDLEAGSSIANRAYSTDGCADVLLLGAGGNHERPSASTGGFGRTAGIVRAEYLARARAEGRTVEDRAVGFATQEARTLVAGARLRDQALRAVDKASVRAWRSGLDHGVREARSVLRQTAARCPDQKIVLTGYAQGAMALHRALVSVWDETDVRDQIVTAVLISDGDRVPRTRAGAMAGSPRASRAGMGVSSRFLKNAPDVPARSSGVRVWNVCTKGDLVCDIGRNSVRSALRAHRSYKYADRGAAQVKKVATRAWARTSHFPAPVADLVEVDTNESFSEQLPVHIARSDTDRLRWDNATNLPDGVSLTRDGLLTGNVTQAGEWAVRYTVRNTRPGYTVPVHGEVTISVRAVEPGPDPARSPSVDISAGGTGSCEVRADGSAWCWGRNNWGQLGDGTTSTRLTPARVGGPADTTTDWARISTSGATTCAVKTDHTLWCWGLNNKGQLGDGTARVRRTPVRVAGGDWATVATGWFHTCATKTTGALYCWGLNNQGQLGDGTATSRRDPARVGSSGWAQVATGGWHTCAVKRDGTAWCWGQNTFGQLGIGTLAASRTPAQIGTGHDWKQLSASWTTTCGVVGWNSEARCWGANDWGQIGDGTTTDRRYANTVRTSTDGWKSIAVGDGHVCAVALDDTAWCWGKNVYGELGDAGTTAHDVPAPVAGDLRWRQLSSGWYSTCGVRTDGTSWCWGNNENGQLGNGSTSDASMPSGTA